MKKVLAKYLFLDIVNYTLGKNIEAQSKIIKELNKIVVKSLDDLQLRKKQVIKIPTGDGMCIAIVDSAADYDCNLELALRILKRIKKYNSSVDDEMLKFEVRIGLNENTDNLITDINRHRNLAGKGINQAQRIMDQGDSSQIMVGTSTHEQLSPREKYFQQFHEYPAKDKHNDKFFVYHYVGNADRLNINPPKKLTEKTPLDEAIGKIISDDRRLDKLEIVHAEYGSDRNRIEVTQEIKDRIVHNKLIVVADNNIKGDPDPGIADKWLYVVYSLGGKISLKYSLQGNMLELP